MKADSRHFIVGSAAALALIATTGVAAQQRHFDIPPDKAVRAIPEFARQAGIQIIAPAGSLEDRTTPSLQGDMDMHEALRRLIAGTGLEIVSDDGAVIILRVKEVKKISPRQLKTRSMK